MGWDEWKHEGECDFRNERLSAMCCGKKASTTLKIVTNLFFRNTIIYEKYVCCKGIYKMKLCMCKKNSFMQINQVLSLIHIHMHIGMKMDGIFVVPSRSVFYIFPSVFVFARSRFRICGSRKWCFPFVSE
jgi:hypothetical protein